MKKLFASIVLVIALCSSVFAAGTWSQSLQWLTNNESKAMNTAVLTFTWTSTSQGVVTCVLSPALSDSLKGTYLNMMITKSGTVASNYGVTLVDEYAVDILGGVGALRTVATQQVTPYVGAAYTSRPVSGPFTFTVSSGGDTKSGTTILYFNRVK